VRALAMASAATPVAPEIDWHTASMSPVPEPSRRADLAGKGRHSIALAGVCRQVAGR
jgi:hypothetical protein